MARHAMKSARKRHRIDRYLLSSGILFLGLILCFAVALRISPQDRLELFFLVCTVGCFYGSSAFFAAWALRHNTRERLEKLAHEPAPVYNLNADYRATHDLSDAILFAIFAIFLGLAAFRIAADGIHLGMATLLSAMSLFFFASLYKSLFFSVLFTDKLMVVEMKPFISYSESYDSVTAIHLMPNNRKVIFQDGKSVNLGYGVGDSRRIAAILGKHVHVVPEERWHLL